MKMISGGVCAPKGYKANGIHCGIRKNRSKRDLALIYSETKANAAAVYTTNLVKGAPLTVTKNHIADGYAQAVICNSGNANTCNANGMEVAEQMSAKIADALKISAGDIVVASTGVIGQPLDITPIADGISELVSGLSENGGELAAEAIMTTDTVKKEIAVEFTIGGKTCRLGGIAKGCADKAAVLRLFPAKALTAVEDLRDIEIFQPVQPQRRQAVGIKFRDFHDFLKI